MSERKVCPALAGSIWMGTARVKRADIYCLQDQCQVWSSGVNGGGECGWHKDVGVVDDDCSSIVPLGANEVFEGEWTSTLEYGVVVVAIATDQGSAIDGLEVQWSADGVTKTQDDVFTIQEGGAAKVFTFGPANAYMRIKYTNGPIAQESFTLQTILRSHYFKPSSHRIQDPIVDEDDAELVKAVLSGESEVTGIFENVTTYRGSLNVNSAYLHRKIVNEIYHREVGLTTVLESPAFEGDTSIIIVDATGLVAGDEIKLTNGSTQEAGVMTVTGVVTVPLNIVTLDRPLGNDYPTGAEVLEVETNMSLVAGTLANPIEFEVDPPIETVWQITRLLISLIHDSAADDSKFGSLPALTDGVALRAVTAAGRTVVFSNWKTNRDMKLDMYNVDYTDKAGPGLFGTNCRWTFTAAEVVAELDGDADPIQKLTILIQDDLTDLTDFKVKAQGRVFTPI